MHHVKLKQAYQKLNCAQFMNVLYCHVGSIFFMIYITCNYFSLFSSSRKKINSFYCLVCLSTPLLQVDSQWNLDVGKNIMTCIFFIVPICNIFSKCIFFLESDVRSFLLWLCSFPFSASESTFFFLSLLFVFCLFVLKPKIENTIKINKKLL